MPVLIHPERAHLDLLRGYSQGATNPLHDLGPRLSTDLQSMRQPALHIGNNDRAVRPRRSPASFRLYRAQSSERDLPWGIGLAILVVSILPRREWGERLAMQVRRPALTSQGYTAILTSIDKGCPLCSRTIPNSRRMGHRIAPPARVPIGGAR